MSVPRIFDRRVYALRRARAARRSRQSILAARAAEILAERLSAVSRRFAHALDLGSRPEIFARLAPRAESWVRAGLAPEVLPRSAPAAVADEECLPFAESSFDLIVSVLSLHAVNDLPGALIQIRRALVPDGLFMGVLFGGSTLAELRRAFAAGEIREAGGVSPRVAPFADVRDLGGLLQRAGFALPVADVERLNLRYRAFSTLAEDIRALGESNALAERSRTTMRRAVLASSLAHYAAHESEPDGRLRATFDLVFLAGWAPHENQPRPLAPGSARTRLADALGAADQSRRDRQM